MVEDASHALRGTVIGCAIRVHQWCGPALLEGAYEQCLAHELRAAGVPCEQQVQITARYRDTAIVLPYRLDLLVEGRLVIELKTVEKVLPVHEAQLLSYLRLGAFRHGILINFRTPVLRDGLRTLTNQRAPSSPPPHLPASPAAV